MAKIEDQNTANEVAQGSIFGIGSVCAHQTVFHENCIEFLKPSSKRQIVGKVNKAQKSKYGSANAVFNTIRKFAL